LLEIWAYLGRPLVDLQEIFVADHLHRFGHFGARLGGYEPGHKNGRFHAGDEGLRSVAPAMVPVYCMIYPLVMTNIAMVLDGS